MTPPLLRFDAVSKRFGGVSALEEVSLELLPGGSFARAIVTLGCVTTAQALGMGLYLRLREPGEPPRPMTQKDVIVVAAYNAQVECLSQALAEAGFEFAQQRVHGDHFVAAQVIGVVTHGL